MFVNYFIFVRNIADITKALNMGLRWPGAGMLIPFADSFRFYLGMTYRPSTKFLHAN